MTARGSLPVRAIMLLLAVLVLVVLYRQWPTVPPSLPPDLQGVMRPAPRPLEPFHLVDQSGKPFNRERFAGGWSLVFFGYTYCPDICPATLATLVATVSELRKNPEDIPGLRVIFVSVDPQRDTPRTLAGYMAYFNDTFTGVTGEKGEIDGFARQFGAGYIIEPEHAPGEYLVSHTSSIFLVDPSINLIAGFSPPHDPATLVSQLRAIKQLD